MPSDEPSIRGFSPADQEAVRALILSGLEEHWGHLDESLNPDLRDIAVTYRHGRTVVVEVAGQLVGTGTLVPAGEGAAEIRRMSVRPDCRRQGIGWAIVESLTTTAWEWGATRVVLETSTDWTEAVEFYLRCGFVVTHQEEGSFGLDTWFELDRRTAT